MLEIIDLTKKYGPVTALDGMTLNVAAGEVAGLVGHNGAGKTTLVEIVSGLIRQDSGSVTVNGRTPAQAHGDVGVTPQNLALYPSITVREHLELFGRLAGLRRAALKDAIEELAVSLRLTEIMDRSAGVLSGGQQRRTQTASALIHRPGLLLLDEPTAGADLETRRAMLDVVKQRAADGAAVVYTTHYLPELTELQATIAVLRDGRVVARGTCEDLLSDLPGEVRLIFDNEEDVRVSTVTPTATLIELLAGVDRPVTAVELRNADLADLYRALAVDHVA